TIAATSLMTLEAVRAAEDLAQEGIEVEVVDLRTLNPFDEAPVLASVRKTGRLIAADTGSRSVGYAAAVIPRVADQGLADAPLPEVATPSPRIATRSLVHRNPFATVSAVHADFGSFAKDYYVVDFGPRAGIVAVNEGRVLLTAQYRFLLDRVAWEIPGGRVD